jgi:Rrf2 family protein
MSILSKSAEYGLRASIYIVATSQSGHKSGLKEIAAAINSPVFFTAKILQELTRKKIITSFKGPNGGFYVAPDAPGITMLALVEAIDGNDLFTACALGIKYCSDSNPCPLHDQYKPIRSQIEDMLKNTTIQQLAQRTLVNHEQRESKLYF